MVDKTDDEIPRKFTLTDIERTDPPDGTTEGEWYRYVIGKGASAITGKRAGSKRSVTRYVKEFAENLNRRAALGYSAYAARKSAK